MIVNSSIFRSNDIRGISERDLTNEVVYGIGRAVGMLAYQKMTGKKRVLKFAVGRDVRLSGKRIAKKLIQGLTDSGIEVFDLGLVPTPILYFSVFFEDEIDFDGGIEITGSHNPAQYNGFKIMIGRDMVFGEEIEQLYRIVKGETYLSSAPIQRGNVHLMLGQYEQKYLDWIVENTSLGERALCVVVDAGNGAAGHLIMRLLKRLKVETIGYYIEPDGNFPHHAPDPTTLEVGKEIAKKLLHHKFDLAFGFDGDGDRLGVVDHTGTIQWSDRLLILFSREILRENPGAVIIGEVKCSQQLYDDIEEHNGIPIMAPAGHSRIKAAMKKHKALLAGEMSGHFFFKHRYFGFDDAIYTAVRLLEILSRTPKTLSELLSDLPETFATPELRLACPDRSKNIVLQRVITTLKKTIPEEKIISIDGARVLFEHGWGMVRVSNTQPVISLRVEADSPTQRDLLKNRLVSLVHKAINEI